jgi:uncharacterized protein YjbJ (UPF0337 family)
MNKDQVKGTFKDIAGKTQEQAGKLVGNKEQQAKGLLKQAEGERSEVEGFVDPNKEFHCSMPKSPA